MTVRRSRAVAVAIPLVFLAVLVVIDMSTRHDAPLVAFFGLAPLLASALLGPRGTAGVAALATLAAMLSITWDKFSLPDWVVTVAAVAAVGGAAVIGSYRRVRRDRRLEQANTIAEAAQRALLHPPPDQVGRTGLAARYLSAARGALVGGDLYEALDTEFGVRLLVGDVRGKGLGAVDLAGSVMGTFRFAGYERPDLAAVALDLDSAVRRRGGPEDFVTVVLVEVRTDSTLGVVSCGHPPPMLSQDGVVRPVEGSTRPLGLDPTPQVVLVRWAAGDRLLLYTDGLVEARDAAGLELPEESITGSLQQPSLSECLTALVGRLVAHAGDRLSDDVAVMIAENRAG